MVLARVLACLSATLYFCFVAHSEPLGTQSAVPTVTYFAVSSGQRALDRGEGGGNPFASALIELLGNTQKSLGEFSKSLSDLTKQKSRGRHSPEVSGEPAGSAELPFLSKAIEERREAMVLIVSDYSRSGGAKSLAGAKHDAQRITRALDAAGFHTRVVLDANLPKMREELSQFAKQSSTAGVALIYVTGHSVEVSGHVYLLPGDYPIAQKNTALDDSAITISEIAGVAKATRINAILHGGCRDNPLEVKKN